jgi:hypothetical protein
MRDAGWLKLGLALTNETLPVWEIGSELPRNCCEALSRNGRGAVERQAELNAASDDGDIPISALCNIALVVLGTASDLFLESAQRFGEGP